MTGLRRRLAIAAGVLVAALLLLELVVRPHPYFPVAGLFGFNAWFGLGSGLVIVLVAMVWGAAFRRGEDFYDD